MHFSMAPFGSAGDVYPFLGLALKLRERGHQISFVVGAYFEEVVKRHGLDYVELGTREEFLAALSNPHLWNPARAFPHVFAAVASCYRRHYEILAEQSRDRPTVAISSCLGFGARIAQEKLGIPLVTLHLQPAVIPSKAAPPQPGFVSGPRWLVNAAMSLGERWVIDRVACPELNAFRGELGLPPMRKTLSWWHSPQQVICLFPDWFAPRQVDWPPHLVHADFPLWDDQPEAALSADLQSFLDEGDSPVVFTPGSANIFGRPFFEAAVDACRRLNRRGLLLSRFRDHVPKDLPLGVRHFDYVPFPQLLPRAAAVVHHGGIGSTAQGLAAGVPQLIMALAHDQFDNGHRIRKLGVGAWLSKRRFRGPLVADRLGELIHSQRVAASGRAAAARLLPRNGLDLAADAVEAFVASL